MPSEELAGRPNRPSLRRPNGRPQACEPCRRRKVACDNSQPVCRRCQKAARDAQCQYIVDPRMSILTPSTPAQSAAPVSSLTPPGHQPRTTREPSSGSFSSATDPRVDRPFTGPGYLGPTSFCNIYVEAEENLSLFREHCESTVEEAEASLTMKKLPELSPKTLETCLVVLRTIPSRAEAEKLCSLYTSHNSLWLRLVGHKTLQSLFDTFGQYLGEDRPDAGLAELAKRLCYNTSRPLLENEEDPERWTRQFSGVNFRWEALGILFTYWALGANMATPLRAELLRDPWFKSRMTDYLESIEICIQLCRNLNDGNSFLLFVLLGRTILESMRSGDASPLVSRFHSDTISLLTFLGLHAQPNGPSYQPTICSEWKRRVCAYVFNIDKVIASFTGRPPALGRRYMLTPMPLDLADQDLLGNKEFIAQAVKKLNANGWNKDGVISPSTVCRARSMIAFYRDELFELAMGHSLESTVEKLLDILQRESEMMTTLPAGLLYNVDDLLDPEIDQNMLHSRLLVRLEHLQNHFFIYRMLIQRGHDSQADLVAVSFEMVSLALLYWTHLDRLPRVVRDLEWIVMAYAAPSGGILSQELLNPRATPDVAANGGKEGPSRFAIIEKLFLLMGFLDWVSPNAPNSDLCRSCKRVIRLVLEKVTQKAPSVPGVRQAAPVFEPWNWDLGGTSLDFEFDLLDTFEWLRPEVPSSQGTLDQTLPG